MEPTTPTPEPIPAPTPKKSLPLWVYGAIVAVILAGLSAFLAPAYKQTIKERDTYKAQASEYATQIATLQKRVDTLTESVSKSYISGTIKVPVWGPKGDLAYRTATYKAYNMNSAKAQITDTLSSVASSSSGSSSVTETVHVKDTTTIKRMAIDVGLGYSTTATWWTYFGARIFGPIGAFAEAELDPTKGFKLFRQGVGGVKLSF